MNLQFSVQTEAGTAGISDYEIIEGDRALTGQTICIEIMVLPDIFLEEIESFSVSIESEDDRLIVLQSQAQAEIRIIDGNSE